MTSFDSFFERLLSDDGHIPDEQARCARKTRLESALQPQWQQHRDLFSKVAGITPTDMCFQEDVVRFGRGADLSTEETSLILEYLKLFSPWKKGPFEIFGNQIDAEWRSNVKWNRIKPFVGSLEGKVVADIGCHNGYFMFRMAHENPALVIGLEPVVKHWFVASWLKHMSRLDQLRFELLGLEHIDRFPGYFDVVFCMGILYHHKNPVEALENMRKALKPGGKVVIDCQGIPGEGPLCLVPRRKYAGATGIWYLPTAQCLENWVARAGFSSWKVCYKGKLTSEEQRSTKWAEIKSLKDFLSEDGEQTMEGYPAPVRIYGIAER
ncbi:MAG: tRNA 5-methoxyuridine(34)/uridine 5-oxyacetic acid(34) synthase CmoB [Oligoflexales bacterium]